MLHRAKVPFLSTGLQLYRHCQQLTRSRSTRGRCYLLVSFLLLNRVVHVVDSTGTSHLHQSRKSLSTDSTNAFNYISAFQDPVNCTGHLYTVVNSGFGGGFASQFQVSATEWLKVAAAYNYTVPVLIRGHLRGYSDGKECSHVQNDWTCLFLPMSSCQESLLLTGRRVDGPPPPPAKASVDTWVVPVEFRHRGLAWWWGVVQAYMFRLQPNVELYIAAELAHMNHSFPPLGHAFAGLHVRHGDKASDGFKHQSFEAELRALHKSPDCVSQYNPPAAAAAESNASATSSSSSTADQSAVAMCLTHSRDRAVNTSSIANLADNSSPAAAALTPLKIFVASDDASVLALAKRMGLLADSSGVSQQTSTKGMFATMLARPDIGYNASLEIITDIYFLSRCTTLVGIAASQVFRVAVGISNANGLLRAAIVMDHDQTGRIKRMSEKFGLPFPEVFINANS